MEAVIYFRLGAVEYQLLVTGTSYVEVIVKGANYLKRFSKQKDFEILGIV